MNRNRFVGPVSYTHLDVYKRQAVQNQLHPGLTQMLGIPGSVKGDASLQLNFNFGIGAIGCPNGIHKSAFLPSSAVGAPFGLGAVIS